MTSPGRGDPCWCAGSSPAPRPRARPCDRNFLLLLNAIPCIVDLVSLKLTSIEWIDHCKMFPLVTSAPVILKMRRICTWSLPGAAIILTIVPPELRLVTGLPHSFEHFALFFL